MQAITLKPTEPIREPVTKFGGQPTWIAEPQWPIAKSDGKPMRFICQIRLPEKLNRGNQQMAYIFMTDSIDGESWSADFGDNAVILQPGQFTSLVKTEPRATGPSLQRMVPGVTGNRLVPVDCEYRAEHLELPDEASVDSDYALVNRIGGAPGWLQNDETPTQGVWHFLTQIDSNSDLYSVNFGDMGIGYVFVADDGSAGRFLWQCS
jgi:uncharacterized protein YwqG